MILPGSPALRHSGWEAGAKCASRQTSAGHSCKLQSKLRAHVALPLMPHYVALET